MTTITAIDNATPYPGEEVTLTLADASATGKAVSCSSGYCTIVSQSSTEIVFVCPEPHSFGTRQIDYNDATVFTVTDGAESDTQAIDIQPSPGEFWGVVTATDGFNATGTSIGNSRYAKWAAGGGMVDIATGVAMPTDRSTLQIWNFTTSWTASPTEIEYVPPLDDGSIDLGLLGVVKASAPVWGTSVAYRGGDR